MKEAIAKSDEKVEINCPVQTTFGCTMKHTWVCQQCHHQTSAVEPFNEFSLDLPQDSSAGSVLLGDLLRNFLQEEEVEKKCNKCSCTKATVSHCIVKTPRVLVLHLKRFRPNFATQTYDKLTTAVQAQQSINIGNVCECQEEESDLQYSYDLQGVISHAGSSIYAGHYVSDVFDQDTGKWHNYDDSYVKEFNVKSLCTPQRQQSAYLIFFVRRDLKPIPTRSAIPSSKLTTCSPTTPSKNEF